MAPRLILSLALIAFVLTVGGFTVFAAWDVPVKQTEIDKTLDNSQFLQKSL